MQKTAKFLLPPPFALKLVIYDNGHTVLQEKMSKLFLEVKFLNLFFHGNALRQIGDQKKRERE